MLHTDSEFARQFAGKLVSTIQGETDKEAVANSIGKVYASLGLAAPQVIWCEDLFQFASLPIVYRMLSAGNSITSAKLGSLFSRDKSIERLWLRAEELVGVVGPMGKKLNSRLTSLLADASRNLTMAANRTLGYERMQEIEDGLEETLGGCANWSMDNAVELTRSQCAVRARLEGNDSQLSAELLLGDAWGMWDLRWLAAHACAAGLVSSATYQKEVERTRVQEWVRLIEGGQAYLFFENVCFVFQYPSRTDARPEAGTTIPASVESLMSTALTALFPSTPNRAPVWMRRISEALVGRVRVQEEFAAIAA